MGFDVIVPFRADQQDRKTLWEWNYERWMRLFPEANIIVCDSGDEPFSRSKSRNQAVALADTEVLVFADADTVPLPAFVREAVRVAGDGEWCIAYGDTDYYNLSFTETARYMMLSPMSEVRRPQTGEYDHKLLSWAGMFAVPRKAFDQVGGYDERFVGWGHEDVAFRLKLDNEYGKHARINDGYAVHLDHNRVNAIFDGPTEMANRALFRKEYEKKYGWKDERNKR